MMNIDYNEQDDSLRLEYQKEIDVPKVKILDNGTIFEFDYKDNLIAIIFPNFFRTINMRPIPNAIFSIESTQIIEDRATFAIKMNEQLINLQVDFSGLGKN